jgi:C1A family cysteine protease
MLKSGKYHFGYVPDLADQRDLLYAIPPLVALPPKVDLRPGCRPIYDQGDLGSCTANAIAAAFDFERKRQGAPFMDPSRLFIYYNERMMEGTIRSDSGAMIRDGMKSIKGFGAAPETDWPYDVAKFTSSPPQAAYRDALLNQALKYARVTATLRALRSRLAQGFPVVFGFSVYDSFMSQTVENTGIIPMPTYNEEMIGGHAVLAVGYDDTVRRVIVQNSWGTAWGAKGFCYFPYDYFTEQGLTGDEWTLQLVEV